MASRAESLVDIPLAIKTEKMEFEKYVNIRGSSRPGYTHICTIHKAE